MPPATITSAAAVRFERRIGSSTTLLRHQLKATSVFHDLNRNRLKLAHRDVQRLARKATVPTPAEYWERTAVPMADNFLRATRQAIDTEAEELTSALEQYAAAVRRELSTRNLSGHVLSSNLAEHRRVADAGVHHLVAVLADDRQINELGAWWQARLRRRAIVKSARRLLLAPVNHVELIVAATEMELLEQAPWSHDDRLLSAFELAHGQLRRHAVELEHRLRRRAGTMFDAVERDHRTGLIDGSAVPSLLEHRPITIELT